MFAGREPQGEQVVKELGLEVRSLEKMKLYSEAEGSPIFTPFATPFSHIKLSLMGNLLFLGLQFDRVELICSLIMAVPSGN